MSLLPKLGMGVGFLSMAFHLAVGEYFIAMWCFISGMWALMAGLNEQV